MKGKIMKLGKTIQYAIGGTIINLFGFASRIESLIRYGKEGSKK